MADTGNDHTSVESTGSGYAGGHVALLQLIWGEGFLSPGGPAEAAVEDYLVGR